MQIVVNLLLYEVANVLIYRHTTIRRHGERTELDFRLTLEHRFFHVDGYGSHQSVAYVAIFEVLLIKFLYRLSNMFLESTLMGSALSGVLTVHERMVLLAILVGMSEGNLYVLALEVDDRIDAVVGHGVVEQVFQTMATQDAAPVVHYRKPRVQISIVAEHCLDDVVVELIVQEQRVVGLEIDVCTVFVFGVFSLVAGDISFCKSGHAHLSVAIGTDLKVRTECINSLNSNTVQSDTLLKCL